MIIPHEYVRYDKIKRGIRFHKHRIYENRKRRIMGNMSHWYSESGYYEKTGMNGRKYIKQYWRRPGMAKFLKRQCSRMARKDVPLTNGSSYKKTYDFFWNLY